MSGGGGDYGISAERLRIAEENAKKQALRDKITDLEEENNALLGERDELRAQIRRAEAQITEELTHGPLATYYALRFRAALRGTDT